MAWSGGCRLNASGNGVNEDLGDGSLDDSRDGDASVDVDGCEPRKPCGDGSGLCAGNRVCCDRARWCLDLCCSAGDVCSFGKCIALGSSCASDAGCAEGQLCDFGVNFPAVSAADSGVEIGSDAAGGDASSGPSCLAVKTGRCVPRPPRCETTLPDGEATPCIGACKGVQESIFEPTLKYSWGSRAAPYLTDVVMAPVVVQLDDDNCDGSIDGRDVPEMVFTSFAYGNPANNGIVHAVSVVSGKLVDKWASSTLASPTINPYAHLATGDLDGLPGAEIVACTTGPQRVRAFRPNGSELWTSPDVASCTFPTIADLDGDGKPEVLTETQILDGQTGKILFALEGGKPAALTVADLDGDGVPEIVSPNGVWNRSGKRLADVTAASVVDGPLSFASFVGVADLDLDGRPEIVSINYDKHTAHVWRFDATAPAGATVVRRNVDINGSFSPTVCPPGSEGATKGGGTPTIADFNGDGYPDVGVQGGVAISVLDGKKLMNVALKPADTIAWSRAVANCGGAFAGVVAADFDGDGYSELVSSDQTTLRVLNGKDGAILWSTCNTDALLFESPVVADVDGDGFADIVAVSNAYSAIVCADKLTKTAGVRIFGDGEGRWVRARRIWNQATYHVTNVKDDGSIPRYESPNWKQQRLNDFRASSFASETGAPDLVVSVRPACDGPYSLAARVRNVGEAPAGSTVPISFYAGETRLGTVSNTRVLFPGESEWVRLPLPSPPPGLSEGVLILSATVDESPPARAWHECRTDNNKSPPANGACPK